MQSYVAEIGEIVRAQRRDQEELDTIQEKLSNIVKEIGGQRVWLRLFPYLPFITKTIYYSCTTLAGVQTLGEEYVRLFQSIPIVRKSPSFSARLFFVLLHVFFPLLAQSLIQKAQLKLSRSSTEEFLGIPINNNPKARKSLQTLVEWIRSIGVPQLRRIHLAFFYINGAYYNISKRTAGITYLSLSPQTNIGALKVYRILGILTVAQTAISILFWLGSVLESERKDSEASDFTREGAEEKGLIHPTFRCAVCLEQKNPSTTPCGHLFCWNCIQEHCLTSEGESKCPQCRSIFEPSQMLRRSFCSISNTPSLYFSGIQPTGVPHLGNYFGFIEPWLDLQKSLPKNVNMMLSVVDQHAISVGPKPPNSLRQDIRRMTAGLLACGVCPERTLLFRQSDVPQISQLTWILGALQTVTKLQRLPQFKDKAQKYSKGEVPVGLLIYPLLQAADVLMFKATHVPVGADQSQHLNLLTDLAINFNAKYQTDLFPVPKQVTREVSARVRSLRDPAKKMSKSDPSSKSRLDIIESEEAIFEKCKKAVSDSESSISYEPERRVAISNLIDLYMAVSGKSLTHVLSQDWNTSELKYKLALSVEEKFGPVREKFLELEKTKQVEDILHENGKKAVAIARDNMEQVRQTIGFL